METLPMSFLPNPQIIENAKLTDIIEDIKAKFLNKCPDTNFNDTSPLYELTAQFAYRELLLRERINDVAEKLINDLQIAYAEKRLTTGSLAYYKEKALASPGIVDIEITGKENGCIAIYVIFDPEALKKDPNLLQMTEGNLNSPDVKLLSDHIIVKEALRKQFAINAHLILEKGTQIDLETARKSLIIKLNHHLKIGRGLSRSVLTSLFFNSGVLDIQLKEPIESLLPTEGEVPTLKDIELSYELR